MSEPLPLIAADQLADGESAEVVAAGRIFAVYRIGDVYHVLDGICPHSGGPLGKGTLNGCIVTCPWHGWQFDVTSGQNCLSASMPQQPHFQPEVIDGQVCIRLETPEA
ncbi:MAG: Rieske (2Fe-2S) protein [Planctomycetaceae bacterium]|nr:Rieske (2Fe-2S) protein [Planctomycetaceae bacterium]